MHDSGVNPDREPQHRGVVGGKVLQLPSPPWLPPSVPSIQPADDVFLQRLLLHLWQFLLLLPFYHRGLRSRTEQGKGAGSSCGGFDAHKTFGILARVTPKPRHGEDWLVPAPCMVFPPAPSSQPFSWVPSASPAPSPTCSFASWGQKQIHRTEAKQAKPAANPLVVEISHGVMPHCLTLTSSSTKKALPKGNLGDFPADHFRAELPNRASCSKHENVMLEVPKNPLPCPMVPTCYCCSFLHWPLRLPWLRPLSAFRDVTRS